MPKLVTHKIKVTTVHGRSRNQPDHFMQGYSSVNHVVSITFLHVPIHISINETENDGLVAHQSLVMTLSVRNSLFIFATVGHFPKYAGRFPVLVNFIFNSTNPVIRNIHGHA